MLIWPGEIFGYFYDCRQCSCSSGDLKQLFTGKETCSLHPLTNGLFKVRAKVACPSKYNFSIISLLINILAQGYRGGGRWKRVSGMPSRRIFCLQFFPQVNSLKKFQMLAVKPPKTPVKNNKQFYSYATFLVLLPAEIILI